MCAETGLRSRCGRALEVMLTVPVARGAPGGGGRPPPPLGLLSGQERPVEARVLVRPERKLWRFLATGWKKSRAKRNAHGASSTIIRCAWRLIVARLAWFGS